MKKFLPFLLLVCSCSPYTEGQLNATIGDQYILRQTEPDIYANISTINRGSNISFVCKAWWEGGPLDARAPYALNVQVCLGGKCVRNNLGSVAEVVFWASEFDFIQSTNKEVICAVYMPDWFTMAGIPPNTYIDERFPEEMILRQSGMVKFKTEEVANDFRDYCARVECDYDGCECVEWE